LSHQAALIQKRTVIEAATFPEFLTLPAYEMITANIT